MKREEIFTDTVDVLPECPLHELGLDGLATDGTVTSFKLGDGRAAHQKQDCTAGDVAPVALGAMLVSLTDESFNAVFDSLNFLCRLHQDALALLVYDAEQDIAGTAQVWKATG